MLTENWDVSQSQSDCRVEITGDGMRLFSSDQRKNTYVRQNIPSFERGSVLKLSADMKVKDVQPGDKPWKRARLLLVQNDGKKDRWDLPHLVSAFTGSRDWGHHDNFFTVGPATEKMRVAAQLSNCTGSFELKNLRLYPVNQVRIYTWVKIGVLSLWGFFFIVLLRACFLQGNQQMILHGMLILAFIAIIIATTMPGDIRNQVSAEVKTQIRAAGDVLKNEVVNNDVSWDLSKVGHFSFFAVFGLILSLLMNREPVLPAMSYILFLAGGTEMAQFYIDGRTPLFWDFVIDVAGGAAGMILIRLMNVKKGETGLVNGQNLL